MKYDYFDIANEERGKWESICPPGEFQIGSGSSISKVLDGIVFKKLFTK